MYFSIHKETYYRLKPKPIDKNNVIMFLMVGYLVLENGQVFEGERIGFNKDAIFEVVFNTSMSGYIEVLTDPSYVGQAVVFTYPLIGNYGVMKADGESNNV
jgi:carbamoyl-phosphate synthase small subunit